MSNAEAVGVKRSSYIPTLDGWRAVAILAVLGYHSPAFKIGPVHVAILHNYGTQGVDLFFALSGLLICTKLLTEETDTGGISLRAFYLRRVFRILPAAYVYLACVGVLGLLRVIPMPVGPWLAAVFSMTNYYGAYETMRGLHPMYWYTAHFWTLAIEEHFYLALPGLLVLLPRHRKALLAGLILLFTVWYWVFRHGFADRTDLRIDSLLIPAFLAVLLQSDRVTAWFKAWLHPLVAVVLLGIVSVAIAKYGGPFEVMKPLLKVVYPLLIVSTMLHPAGWLGRFLELPPLRWIGKISYSIYLWQQLFFLDERETAAYHSPWLLHALQHLPANMICVFAMASLSYYFVEKPLIRLGHRFVRKPPAPQPPQKRERDVLVASGVGF